MRFFVYCFQIVNREILTWIVAANSAPKPLVRGASWATSTLPVFFTDYIQSEGELANFCGMLCCISDLLCIQFPCPMAKSILGQWLHNSHSIDPWLNRQLRAAHEFVYPIQSWSHRCPRAECPLFPMNNRTLRLALPRQPHDIAFSVQKQCTDPINCNGENQTHAIDDERLAYFIFYAGQ